MMELIEYKMNQIKKLLMYLETRECRQCMAASEIYEKRKKATELFKAYIAIFQKQSVPSNTGS